MNAKRLNLYDIYNCWTVTHPPGPRRGEWCRKAGGWMDLGHRVPHYRRFVQGSTKETPRWPRGPG